MASMVQAFASVGEANQWLSANASAFTPISVCYGHVDNSVVILVAPAPPPASEPTAKTKQVTVSTSTGR